MASEFKRYDGIPTNKKAKNYNKKFIKTSLLNMFKLICCEMFKWNLKELNGDVDGYIIERLGYDDGRALLSKYGGHYFFTKVAKSGKIDAVGRLVSAEPITLDGAVLPRVNIRDIVKVSNGRVEVEKKNAVLFKNNLLDTPTISFIMPYLDTLEYIWQTLQIQLSNMRVKRIITTNDNNQRSVIKNEIAEAVDGIESVLVVSNNNFTSDVKVLESAQNSQDIREIKDLYNWLYNWLMTFLGINNTEQSDKLSGVSSEETKANNNQIALFRESLLSFRRQFCEDVKEVFGVNISVEFNKNVDAEKVINNMFKQEEDKKE